MFKLNRFDNRQTRVVMPEVMIKFVCLIDIVVALTEAIIYAKTWDNGPDDASWVKAAIRQQQRKDRGCCAFAMHTTNGERTLVVHKFPKHLLPCYDLYTTLVCSQQFWILRI